MRFPSNRTYRRQFDSISYVFSYHLNFVLLSRLVSNVIDRSRRRDGIENRESRETRFPTIRNKRTNVCQRTDNYNGVFVFLSVALFHVSWYLGGRNTGSQVSQSCEYTVRTSKQCVRAYGVTDRRRVSFRLLSSFFIFSQLVRTFFLAIQTAGGRGAERERERGSRAFSFSFIDFRTIV